MNELINFLRKEEDLELDKDNLRIIKKEKITGRDFFKTTKDEFGTSAERTYCTKADYHIALTKDILDDDIKLRQGVKEVMEVIVGLLKDWVEVDDSPDIKKARMEKYIKGIIDHNILV
ncbi:hypothetical protein GLOIN_2v1769293 [Rhizophagus irregularis DAOM 181602=DAOM 197198]|uniref:Uncharacterized protein n=1 Tax=Rhizophagus irregularis (strain DAOM 181602 / DAOM 197198 / MUCL 43194) TaxID=747089 RepID=A0A2P4QF39_RHIID|nr:hypothetical protein GLOIN_2v1769293 [Rhizophagus irregularis DAOM 181602=DAOM 197198]POG76265.1 hypothetical protein GLOIN_2v1769293 [Rhizophagus irregularis DAOM 181602=DAOM 197198]|eukprot:XP_025183131.1 hypothetical protein GLOIN_2v1769293 [Rhizophagus irregularis DAOM 181602=DAOM 197198]